MKNQPAGITAESIKTTTNVPGLRDICLALLSNRDLLLKQTEELTKCVCESRQRESKANKKLQKATEDLQKYKNTTQQLETENVDLKTQLISSVSDIDVIAMPEDADSIVMAQKIKTLSKTVQKQKREIQLLERESSVISSYKASPSVATQNDSLLHEMEGEVKINELILENMDKDQIIKQFQESYKRMQQVYKIRERNIQKKIEKYVKLEKELARINKRNRAAGREIQMKTNEQLRFEKEIANSKKVNEDLSMKLNEMKSKVEDLKKQNNDLQNNSQALLKESDNLEIEEGKYKKENIELENAIKKQVNRINNLQESISFLMADNSDYQKSFRTNNDRLKKLENESNKLNIENQKLVGTIAQLELQKSSLESEYEATKNQNKSLKDTVEDNKNDIELLKSKLINLKSELKLLKEDKNFAIKEENRIKKQIETVRQEVDVQRATAGIASENLREELKALEESKRKHAEIKTNAEYKAAMYIKEKCALESSIRQIEEENDFLINERKAIIEKLEDDKSNADSSKISLLKEIASLRQQIEDIKLSEDESLNMISQLKSYLQNEKETPSPKRNKKKKGKRGVKKSNSKTSKIESTDDQNSIKGNRVNKIYDNIDDSLKITGLEEEVAKMKEEKESIQSQILDFDLIRDELIKQKEELAAEIALLKENLSNNLENHSKDNLESEIRDLSIQKEVYKLECERNDKSASVDRELIELELLATRMREEIEALKINIEHKQKENSDKKENIRNEIENMKKQQDNLNLKKEMLKSQIKEQKDLLRVETEKESEIEKEIENLEKQKSDFETNHNPDKIPELENKKRNLEQKIKQIKSSNQIEDKVRELQDDIDVLEFSYESAKAELKKQEREMEKVKNNLIIQRDKLQNMLDALEKQSDARKLEHQKTVEVLEEEIKESHERFEQLESAFIDESEIERLRNEIDTSNNEVKQRMEKNRKMATQLMQLQNEAEKLRRDRLALTSEEKKYVDEISKINTEREFILSGRDLEQLKKEVSLKKSELEEIKNLSKEIEKADNKIKNSECLEILQKQLEDIEEESLMKETEIEITDANVEEVKEQITDTNKEVARLTEELEVKQRYLAEAMKSLDTANKEANNIKKAIEQLYQGAAEALSKHVQAQNATKAFKMLSDIQEGFEKAIEIFKAESKAVESERNEVLSKFNETKDDLFEKLDIEKSDSDQKNDARIKLHAAILRLKNADAMRALKNAVDSYQDSLVSFALIFGEPTETIENLEKVVAVGDVEMELSALEAKTEVIRQSATEDAAESISTFTDRLVELERQISCAQASTGASLTFAGQADDIEAKLLEFAEDHNSV